MPSSGTRIAVGILVALAAALGAAGCGEDEAPTSSGGDKLTKVELLTPFQDSISFLGMLVAKDRYFEGEGLAVETLPSEGSDFVVQQVVSGNIDFGFGNQANVLLGATKAPNIRGFGVIDSNAILMGIPADSAVQSPEDLEGQTFGITDFGGGEVAVARSVFEDAGIEDSVELVAVGPGGPSVFNALSNGEIAGYGGFTHDIAGVEAQGLEIRNILPDEFTGLPSNGFISSQEVLESPEGRKIAIALLRGWSKGTTFALENPDQSLEIACKYVPEDCADMDSASVLHEIVLDVIPPPDAGFGIYDYDKMELLGDIMSRLRDSDQAAIEALDLQQIFPNEYAEAANSEGG